MHDDKVIYMGWQEEAFAEIRGRLEAENARLRAALEQIAAEAPDDGCDNYCTGSCREFLLDDRTWCVVCLARAALEEK